MNIRCPECDTVYRVDPDRLPAEEVRTRCDNCGTLLAIGRGGTVAALRVEAAAPTAGPAPHTPPPATDAGGDAPAGPVHVGGEEVEETETPVFGPQDPDTRARRLARALVSDIVVYHPERREKSLEAGTLRTDFREEVLKSWEEYVEQVGEEMAKKTPFFRDALNEILAKGRKVF